MFVPVSDCCNVDRIARRILAAISLVEKPADVGMNARSRGECGLGVDQQS